MFQIVCGERRFRAHKMLGMETIKAFVKEMTDAEMQIAAIIENLRRKDISPIEEAHAFQGRLDAGLSVNELAEQISVQPSFIRDRVSLLKLAPNMQEAVAKGALKVSYATRMAKLNPDNQRTLFYEILNGKVKKWDEIYDRADELLAEERQAEMFSDDGSASNIDLTNPPSARERNAGKNAVSALASANNCFDKLIKNNGRLLNALKPAVSTDLAAQIEKLMQLGAQILTDLNATATDDA